VHIRSLRTFVLLASLAPGAWCQQAPSSLDARAAYCIPVVKNEIAWKSQLLQEWSATGRDKGVVAESTVESLMRRREQLLRLTRYIESRFSVVDENALAVFLGHGESDVLKSKMDEDACSARCAPTSSSKEPRTVCLLKCNNESVAFARTSVCASVDWLPH
jgi:hypothetical protein